MSIRKSAHSAQRNNPLITSTYVLRPILCAKISLYLRLARCYVRTHILMDFQDLHELLRAELERRINAGKLTGTMLARMAGFQQAHISNFLNKKRALSLEGLDRVLASQNLSVEQILPLDLAGTASRPPNQADPLESVPVVTTAVAMDDPRIAPSAAIETVHVSAARLHGNRPRMAPDRQGWERFVALRVDADQAAPMDPILTNGSIVVLDRHYNSVAPYRSGQPSIFAARTGSALHLRFVTLEESRLILRPYAQASPIKLIRLLQTQTPADFIVGRVCLTISDI